MIPPLKFFWEQLDGPQVTAIMQCTYDFWFGMFNNILEYLNNLSIDTANDSHLDVIGVLMNIPRPLIRQRDIDEVLFTDGLEHPSTRGFSDGPNGLGGQFSDIGSTFIVTAPVAVEMFRTLLQAVADSYGKIGSLVLLDDIIYAFAQKVTQDLPEYTFDFVQTEGEDRSIGDVEFNVGRETYWGRQALTIQAIFEAMGKHIYSPAPKLIVSLSLT